MTQPQTSQVLPLQATVAPSQAMSLIAAPQEGMPAALATRDTAALAVLEPIWDQARYDAEIRAARRQMARGAAELAEGKVRLATLLVRLRATQDYLRWGYNSLETYLQTMHEIGEKAAHRYIRSLESLGSDLMRQLLRDVGMQRTFCLAQIRDQDPEVFLELLEVPAADGGLAVATMDVQELERINAELTSALEEAYQRYADKEDELAAAKQISRTTHTRIEDVDRHNRDLVLARDRAERDRAQSERELEQERKKKALLEREAKRTVADLQRQLRELSDKLRQPVAPNAAPVTIEVIATNDPRLLAGLVQLCAQGMRGANVKALHTASGPAQEVGAAVGELISAGVPAILIAAVRACATAVRAALEPGALTVEEAAAVRAALHEFGAAVAPALRTGEGNHG
jgi:hypothetical protein